MKKLMLSLIVLALVSVPMFAGYTNPDIQTVKVSTTIAAVASMSVVSGSGTDFTEVVLPEGTTESETFYVKTVSNVAGGFKLEYKMSALKGTGNNTQVIPLTVISTADSEEAEEKIFTTADRKSKDLIRTTSSVGTEHHSVAIKVKANDANWKTSVKADTYSADMVFSFLAN